jgi:site-specific DNA recombinase
VAEGVPADEHPSGLTSAGRSRPPTPWSADRIGDSLRFAWWGRVSTEDQQDPTLSLPRQLNNSRSALPPGATIVAHFYDIESGRKDLDARGLGHAHDRFDIPIPRDGGIKDLLAEADDSLRRFDAVICESIERIARRTYYGTKIEHELERAGVALFAADEPIVLSGKRATTILTRRVKQGVAEWYVLEMLEKSWDGFLEHTRQGWNVGRPPYGYRGDPIPHPVPARRAEGRTKTKLVPDPVTAPVVLQIFQWRAVDRLGYAEITDRLNADLTRYPPPISPDPARTRTDWIRSAVRDVLCNPKYTGYMVWNRRATKRGGKVNPPELWVWSELPTHEPLVPRDLFKAAAGISGWRQGSRTTTGENRGHPQAKRTYVLRSFVFCEICDKRMFGKSRHGVSYYACQPDRNIGQAAEDRFPGHGSVWIREDDLLKGLSGFLAQRIFGPERRELLAQDLVETDTRTETDRVERIHSLRKTLTDIRARGERLMLQLETQDDPDGTLFARVRDRVTGLAREERQLQEELRALEAEVAAIPRVEPALLDSLPTTPIDLSGVPDPVLRPFFESLRLRIRYDRRTHRAIGYVTLDEAAVSVMTTLVSVINGNEPEIGRSHVVGAPGRIRTCAPASGGQCSIP